LRAHQLMLYKEWNRRMREQ